jgi:hypothetical protein
VDHKINKLQVQVICHVLNFEVTQEDGADNKLYNTSSLPSKPFYDSQQGKANKSNKRFIND